MTNANNTDALRRNDLQARTPFETLSPDTQKALVRAASRGAANLTPAQAAEIAALGNSWLMVPTKRFARQVSFSDSRAWRF